MRVSIQEVARRLGLPESTIERWIRQGRIPVRRLGDDCLVDQRELQEWARARNLSFADKPQEQSPARPVPETRPASTDLLAALRRGGVCHDLTGHDPVSVLQAVAAAAPIAEEHRSLLLECLLEREELASTGIGNGIAIPHPRIPLSKVIDEPLITCCFLEQPVDLDAVDGQPIFVLFLLLSPAVTVHLPLLSQLAYLLRDERFLAVLETRPAGDELLRQADEAGARTPGVSAR